MPIVLDLNDDDRWRWFEEDAGRYRVEVYGPRMNELDAAVKQCGDSSAKLRRHVARHWFRAFEGLVDREGKPLENTPETRERILDCPAVWSLVYAKIIDVKAWLEEKNADGGSAC